MKRSRILNGVIALAGCLILGCSPSASKETAKRPGKDKATALCQSYVRMTTREKSPEIAKQGEEVLAKHIAEDPKLQKSLATCVSMLTQRGTQEQAECMGKAKSARAWTDCIQ